MAEFEESALSTPESALGVLSGRDLKQIPYLGSKQINEIADVIESFGVNADSIRVVDKRLKRYASMRAKKH